MFLGVGSVGGPPPIGWLMEGVGVTHIIFLRLSGAGDLFADGVAADVPNSSVNL